MTDFEIEIEGILYTAEYDYEYEPYDEECNYGGFYKVDIECVYINLIAPFIPTGEKVLVLYSKKLVEEDSHYTIPKLQEEFDVDAIEEMIKEYLTNKNK